ncbi:MAG TPA: FtsX-like permease family protein [Symbiobacteriaceae bacterium]|jgi:putative ABC transport system permease protein
MFKLMLRRAAAHRPRRLVAGTLAVTVAAIMVTALLGVSLEIRSKIGRDLQAYGANILVLGRAAAGGGDLLSPVPEDYLREGDLGPLDALPASPLLYGVGRMGERPLALVGVRPERVRQVSPWWQVKGEWPSGDGALVGRNAAQVLAVKTGDRIDLQVGGQRRSLQVTGLLTTGGSEDDQVVLSLPLLQELSGRTGLVSLVQVSAAGDKEPADRVAAQLQGQVPGATVRLLAQTAHAEERVLGKVRFLLILVAAAAVVTALLCLLSTVTAGVLERGTEIGVLKALGAPDRFIAGLFRWEALAAAGSGGLLGWALGLALGQFISRTVFETPLGFHWVTLPGALGVSLAVALAAAWAPVRQAVQIQPATILRGE